MNQDKYTKIRFAAIWLPLMSAVFILIFPSFTVSEWRDSSSYTIISWALEMKDTTSSGWVVLLLFLLMIPVLQTISAFLVVWLIKKKGAFLAEIILMSLTKLALLIEIVFLLAAQDISPSWGLLLSNLCTIAALVFSIITFVYYNQYSSVSDSRAGFYKGAISVSLPASSDSPVSAAEPSPSSPGSFDSPVPVHQIVCTAGEFKGASFPLKDGESIVIGREASLCNIVIIGQNVSRKHCMIRFDSSKNSYCITDYSSNGTYGINGTRLMANMETVLPVGSEIALGSNDNRFRLE